MPTSIYAAAEKINYNALNLWRSFESRRTEHGFQNPTILQDNALVMDWLRFQGFLELNHANPYTALNLPSYVCNSGGSCHASAQTTSSSNPSRSQSESSYVGSRGRSAEGYWDSGWCQIPPPESRCLGLGEWIWESSVAEPFNQLEGLLLFMGENGWKRNDRFHKWNKWNRIPQLEWISVL